MAHIQTQREQFGIFEAGPLTDHFRHNYLDENIHPAPFHGHGEHGPKDDPEISGRPEWKEADLKEMLSGRPIRSGQY